MPGFLRDIIQLLKNYILTQVPLPNNSVDIAIFCLSLMGTNLVDFLVEAKRVLKPRYQFFSYTFLIQGVKSLMTSQIVHSISSWLLQWFLPKCKLWCQEVNYLKENYLGENYLPLFFNFDHISHLILVLNFCGCL